MTFTCKSSQHAFFTIGQTYEGIQGTFGWFVEDNNGTRQRIPSSGSFITSLYMEMWVTRFDSVK